MLSRALVVRSIFMAVLFVVDNFCRCYRYWQLLETLGTICVLALWQLADNEPDQGYDVRLAAGTIISAGGTLGILIFTINHVGGYGASNLLEVPVTDLFSAAIIPGHYENGGLVFCCLCPVTLLA